MKRLLCIWLWTALLPLQPLFAQSLVAGGVRFSSDFDSGCLGTVTLLDSVWVQTTPSDSVLHLSFHYLSRPDPFNPANPELEPSARWFSFRMEGVQGKQIYLDFAQTDPKRAVYSYDGATYTRFESSQAQMSKVSARFTRDTVYVAYCFPYNWAYLQQRIKTWSASPCVRVDTLGTSYEGLPIQMLTVTRGAQQAEANGAEASRAEAGKTHIWIHARIHPSESPGSWQLDGLMDALLAANPVAEAYRNQSVFYVVPFINPDGVYGGYSRSNALGINQEINWNHPDSLTSVEVAAVRAKMAELSFDLVLNIHSQSSDGVSYYIHTAESTTPDYFDREMRFMYLTCADNPYVFPEGTVYSAPAPRYVEGWLWNRAPGKAIALTLETPYSFYQNNDGPLEWVTPETLRESGTYVLRAISDYYQWDVPGRMVLTGRMKGSDTLFKRKHLPAGTYSLYTWDNAWIPAGTHTQKREGTFRFTSPVANTHPLLLVQDNR